MNTNQKQKKCLIVVGAITSLFFVSGIGAKETNSEPASINIPAIQTKIIDGFCIGVSGINSNGHWTTNNTSPDDSLIFLPWTSGGKALITVPAEPEYAYQVELFDSNGVAIHKTTLGKKFGTKFADFDANFYSKGIPIKHLSARKRETVTESPYLFRPSDLFQIDKPGRYTLQIRFQILTFPRTGPGRRDFTNDLIRFPPLNYPLVQTNAPPQKSSKEAVNISRS